jgi:hypothetical protein
MFCSAFRACSTCVDLRNTLHDNASSKRDDKELAKAKRKQRAVAEAAMFSHLDEDATAHPKLTLSPMPTPRYRWINGAYEANSDPTYQVQLTADCHTHVDHLAQQRLEGIPCHWVGVRRKNRLEGIPLDAVTVGDFVIVNTSWSRTEEQEDSAPLSSLLEPPWYVAEVQAIDVTLDDEEEQANDPQYVAGHVYNWLRVLEWGNAPPKKTTLFKNYTHYPHYAGVDPDDAQNPKVQDVYPTTKHPVKSCFRQVVLHVPLESIAWRGVQDDLLTKSHKVKNQVLRHLSARPDINWFLPPASSSSSTSSSSSISSSSSLPQNPSSSTTSSSSSTSSSTSRPSKKQRTG